MKSDTDRCGRGCLEQNWAGAGHKTGRKTGHEAGHSGAGREWLQDRLLVDHGGQNGVGIVLVSIGGGDGRKDLISLF